VQSETVALELRDAEGISDAGHEDDARIEPVARFDTQRNDAMNNISNVRPSLERTDRETVAELGGEQDGARHSPRGRSPSALAVPRAAKSRRPTPGRRIGGAPRSRTPIPSSSDGRSK